MQGEQEHSEWIFLGWTGHGLVAGECVSLIICSVLSLTLLMLFMLFCVLDLHLDEALSDKLLQVSNGKYQCVCVGMNVDH